MSKLTRKFTGGLFLILALVTFCSLYINVNFIPRFFLYKEKQEMNRICDEIISGGSIHSEVIKDIEEREDVVTAWAHGLEDNALLNERLKTAFLEKGISLKKYWLWEEDQREAVRNGRKLRIYSQDKLHYSLMVEYLSWNQDFIAVGKVIPSIKQSLSLINSVTIIIFIGGAIAMFALICVLLHRIVSPLAQIGKAAKSIADLDFKTVEIHTGDELEILANDINHMSRKLKEAHLSLEQKNRQMEDLLANVSHDIKTPVALIKAYASGMKDGLDDGIFLDTIIAQNSRIEQMIERLSELAQGKRRDGGMVSINGSGLLLQFIGDYRLKEKEGKAAFHLDIEENLIIEGNQEALSIIFSNLISNAVKYADDGQIAVWLKRREDHVLFGIQNKAAAIRSVDIRRLWEPFFVAEESRSKDRSGTGLGLSIVKTAAEGCGYQCGCHWEEDWITFTVLF